MGIKIFGLATLGDATVNGDTLGCLAVVTAVIAGELRFGSSLSLNDAVMGVDRSVCPEVVVAGRKWISEKMLASWLRMVRSCA